MKLRRTFTLGALVAGALVVPASAAMAVGCTSGAVGQTTNPDGTGVCNDSLFYVIVGANVSEGEAYLVVGNYPETGGIGYVGVSNYETGDETTECNNVTSGGDPEGGDGTNSGGCYGGNTGATNVHALPIVGPLLEAVPLPVCGDDTGPFENTSRDGCRFDGLGDATALVTDVVVEVCSQVFTPC